MNKQLARLPFAYFITFCTYGSRLHGDKKGSIDCFHNKYTNPLRKYNKNLHQKMQKLQVYNSFILDEQKRRVVMHAIKNTCFYRGWHLYALHVRSNHVHLIVQSSTTPEELMTQLKCYASRALNNIIKPPQKYWARHGSTRYIWSSDFLFPAMRYVIDQQGNRMSYYYEPWYDTYINTDVFETKR